MNLFNCITNIFNLNLLTCKVDSEEETPKRPEAQRSGPVPNQNYQQNNGIFGNGGLFGGNVGQGGPHINFLFFGGFGLLPMLFSLV